MQDQATLEAIRLVSRPDVSYLGTEVHRQLRQLSRQASAEAQRDYWPAIWGDFAERFDAR